MPEQPRMTLTSTVLDCPDAHALAAFYRRLLGWDVALDDADWVRLAPPDGGSGISFQSEPGYTPPTWPSTPGAQQMMLHLDFEITDLPAATAHALTSGATLAPFQPQEDVRVFFDPAGHPFCLWIRT